MHAERGRRKRVWGHGHSLMLGMTSAPSCSPPEFGSDTAASAGDEVLLLPEAAGGLDRRC